MLENFAGNKNLISILNGMLKGGHLPHAILIEGADGLGKRTVARELAKSILCMDSDIYCGACRSCTLFEAGSNPDFSVLKPNKKNLIAVDEIREIRRRAYERPDRCERKVYIIENAEKMNVAAQNAFLKILEEPPQYVVFILLVASSSMLLDTIISRCTVLTLNAPQYSEAFYVLKGLCPETEDTRISDALSITDNNIGKALLQLKGDSEGEEAALVESFLKALGNHQTYEMLKTLKKYKNDMVGFSAFLNLTYSRASVELRRITKGEAPTVPLSRADLIKVTEEVTNTQKNLRAGCILELVITYFCASVTK
jgi:DNA polymerase-3 subunit delta'